MSDGTSARSRSVDERLGYLLKHAREALTALSEPALAPLGITGRELAVLTVIGFGEPPSQLEAARRLGIDRTTMVALLDTLEGKGLVGRSPAADRRRNLVILTEAGREALAKGSAATDSVEQRFLAPLSEADADRLRELLRAVVRRPARE